MKCVLKLTTNVNNEIVNMQSCKYRQPVIGQMSGRFGILTGEILTWPDRGTG